MLDIEVTIFNKEVFSTYLLVHLKVLDIAKEPIPIRVIGKNKFNTLSAIVYISFVCLKNIFASEKFDDIVLREFAELDEQHREVYRLVSAMEDAYQKSDK